MGCSPARQAAQARSGSSPQHRRPAVFTEIVQVLHIAVFLTRPHDRVLPQLTAIAAPSGRLRQAATACQAASEDLIRDASLAA
jgi:hypothetical protein